MSNLPPLPEGEWADRLDPFTRVFTLDQLKAFAEEAVKQEREACAKLCESLDRWLGEDVAAAIRARSQEG